MKSKGAPVFRSSMGGFNRKDVNEYIAKLCGNFEQREAESEKALDELREKLSEYEKKAADFEAALSDNEALKRSLEEAEALIAVQNEKLAEYEETTAKLTASIEESEKKLEEASELEEKLRQYDSMTSRMGEIFMEATADAERIRRDAKLASDELARAAAEECRRRQAEIYKKLDEFAVARKSEINRLLEHTQGTINGALRDFESKARGVTADGVGEVLDDFAASKMKSKAR